MLDLDHCPICKTEAQRLDKIGDADGFDCPRHGKIKVSGTVMATKMDATAEEWEAALKRAKERADSDEWPIIDGYDF